MVGILKPHAFLLSIVQAQAKQQNKTMNLETMFAQLNIEFRRHGESSEITDGWVGVRCPKCSPMGDRFKLGFSMSVPWTGSCWSCGPMKLWEFLSGITGKQGKEIKGVLRELELSFPKHLIHAGKLVMPKGVKEMQKAHRFYLVKRKFDPDEIAKLWHVKGIGNAMRLKWRLFIPIIVGCETLSWTTRALVDEIACKYIAARPDEEKCPASSLLYGIDYVRHAIAVHEGPTDVWRIGPGAVCTMGSKFSKAQVAVIAKIPKRIICFDSEPAAQRRAKELCARLEMFDGETIRVELDAPDPGSATQKEVKLFRKLLK